MTTTFNMIDPVDLISETDVYEKYGNLFVDKELRQARQAGQIAYLDLRKGIFYTKEMLSDYLLSKVHPVCPNNAVLSEAEPQESESKPASSSSKGSGSPKKKAAGLSIVAGMTPTLAKSAADLLRQRT